MSRDDFSIIIYLILQGNNLMLTFLNEFVLTKGYSVMKMFRVKPSRKQTCQLDEFRTNIRR